MGAVVWLVAALHLFHGMFVYQDLFLETWRGQEIGQVLRVPVDNLSGSYKISE